MAAKIASAVSTDTVLRAFEIAAGKGAILPLAGVRSPGELRIAKVNLSEEFDRTDQTQSFLFSQVNDKMFAHIIMSASQLSDSTVLPWLVLMLEIAKAKEARFFVTVFDDSPNLSQQVRQLEQFGVKVVEGSMSSELIKDQLSKRKDIMNAAKEYVERMTEKDAFYQGGDGNLFTQRHTVVLLNLDHVMSFG